jgi:hypothetical protein
MQDMAMVLLGRSVSDNRVELKLVERRLQVKVYKTLLQEVKEVVRSDKFVKIAAYLNANKDYIMAVLAERLQRLQPELNSLKELQGVLDRIERAYVYATPSPQLSPAH